MRVIGPRWDSGCAPECKTIVESVVIAEDLILMMAYLQVKELSEKYENIVPNFGLHPW